MPAGVLYFRDVPPGLLHDVVQSFHGGTSETALLRQTGRGGEAGVTGMSLLHIIFGRLSLQALPFWDMLKHPTRDNIVNGIIATDAASIVMIGAASVAFSHHLVRQVEGALVGMADQRRS